MSISSYFNHSLYLSISIQLGTGILDVYALTKPLPSDMFILKELLILELIVQVVELTFYLWLAMNIAKTKNVTPNRYADWFITTPTMLFTLIAYLIYLNKGTTTLTSVILENTTNLGLIFILNGLMLMFGYFSEINYISTHYAVILGFIPFFIYFKMIYDNYAQYSKNGMILFLYFLIVWSLYGVAAVLPYYIKNIMYNILDLFAKNFFGIFLSYLILSA